MKNLYKALASFQQEVPAIHEGTKGYGYTYSDLKTILRVINPIMARNNLGFTQLLEGENIVTTIFHTESGESISSTTNIPQGITLKGMNTFQIAGSGYTYYRRYALSAALGLVTDVDSDAKGEEVIDNTEKFAILYNLERNIGDREEGKEEAYKEYKTLSNEDLDSSINHYKTLERKRNAINYTNKIFKQQRAKSNIDDKTYKTDTIDDLRELLKSVNKMFGSHEEVTELFKNKVKDLENETK
jgi:hypothetical protein